MKRFLLALIEGIRFFRSITPRGRLMPTEEYLCWRLGTVYGTFDRETGKPRTLEDLLSDLWQDRANAMRFLLWRRQMRLSARRRS